MSYIIKANNVAMTLLSFPFQDTEGGRMPDLNGQAHSLELQTSLLFP
jgi:hypothetical protein